MGETSYGILHRREQRLTGKRSPPRALTDKTIPASDCKYNLMYRPALLSA